MRAPTASVSADTETSRPSPEVRSRRRGRGRPASTPTASRRSPTPAPSRRSTSASTSMERATRSPNRNADGDHRQRNRHLLERRQQRHHACGSGEGRHDRNGCGSDRARQLRYAQYRGRRQRRDGRRRRPRHPRAKQRDDFQCRRHRHARRRSLWHLALWQRQHPQHSGSISTEGESAYGVYSNDGTSTGNTITLEDGSTIATTGSQAHGVYLGQYSSLFVESGESISAQTECPWNHAATHATIEVAGAIESVAVGLFAADERMSPKVLRHPGQGRRSIRKLGLDLYHWYGIYLGDYGKLELESGTSIATEGEQVPTDQYGHERPDRECQQEDEAVN